MGASWGRRSTAKYTEPLGASKPGTEEAMWAAVQACARRRALWHSPGQESRSPLQVDDGGAPTGWRRIERVRSLQTRVVPLVAALLALAACSGGTPSASDTPSPSSAPSVAPPSGQAGTLQNQFVSVVHSAEPSVVQIQTQQGLGSGVVFDNKGDIVTNFHVVCGANKFTVTLADGHQYPATLVGTFHEDDLAVVHVNASGLQPATFADSSKLQVGYIAMAIGNPLALQSSVTEGIVSALGRTESEPGDPNCGVAGTTIPGMIQTSAAINPGNSGGALVDLQGQVIGIPTLAATDQQTGGGQARGSGSRSPPTRPRTSPTRSSSTGMSSTPIAPT